MGTSAALALLRQLPRAGHGGPRIRVVGRVVGLDLERHLLLIHDEGVALVVELPPINDHPPWAPSLKDLVMIAGDLCIPDASFSLPPIQTLVASPVETSEARILRAVWIKPVEELDLAQWRSAVLATSA